MHTKRILRECIWKTSVWKPRLKAWLLDKKFDVVFFMAGDGIFAYDVYRFVMKNISAKGCLFFTDDYIIGRTSNSPAARLRQSLLKKKIAKTLRIVNELYVISDEMREAYHKLFGMDSYVVRNFSVEKKEIVFKKQSDDTLTMVYAGGLHYNRWKVLAQIGRALKEINGSENKKCYLKIYSSQNLSDEIVDSMNVEGSSKFCGGVSAAEIADVYAASDILLHVESFDEKAIASTKYSFSTKIPEYLSAGKCVLAVGPAEVASVRYLTGVACVINDAEKLSSELRRLIVDDEYRNTIKDVCEKQYEQDFSKNKQKECVEHILFV